ncbi:MAG: carbohydrate-binding domain-containing protein [Oscillospiraceae bacterium]|nr:carbohydrate-binding domain-containing protein [Oscillospiraceae bacterium]
MLVSLLLCASFLFCACGKQEEIDVSSDGTETVVSEENGGETASAAGSTDFSKTDEEMFTDRDGRDSYEEEESVRIRLNGDTAVCDSPSVQISGSVVTITGEGTYLLSGSLTDGRIVVNAGKKDKLQLVFDGVSVHSETSAALYILEADKVFVTLANGTENALSNGGSFAAVDDNNIDGAVFSKEDLTFNGSGSLTVTSPGGHGIVCKDDLVFTGGTYTVHAASHGLQANDSVRLTGASLTVEAGKDGVHAENKDDETLGFVYISGGRLDITAAGDGISAEAYLQIEGGAFSIVAGGGSGSKQGDTSCKGMKVTGDMLINNGTFSIDSADDAVHADGCITVKGGDFTISTGDDGFHADDTLSVAGGTIRIEKSYEGLEALHVEISGGDIRLTATDDGINAAGGTDSSGFGGNFGGNDQFGGRPGGGGPDGGRPGGGRPGGGPGGNFGGNSDGTIVISGGTIYVKASGDGIDANGTLEISGGHITVCGPTQGDTATLDYDVSGVITGGTFIGTGAAGMAQTFSDSAQGVLAVRMGNQSAGTQIVVKDSSGKEIVSYAPELPFAVVIVSTPEMVKGETYSITVGSSSGEIQAS